MYLQDNYTWSTAYNDFETDVNGYINGSENINTLIREEQRKVKVELWENTLGLIAIETVDDDGNFYFGRVRKGSDYEGEQTEGGGTAPTALKNIENLYEADVKNDAICNIGQRNIFNGNDIIIDINHVVSYTNVFKINDSVANFDQ